MRLKRLEIYGFKSFADRVEMVFPDGVTGVVGPNGSGKSNIADAVRWVLGEQSAKTLRGAKMEDVIFGGTQTRKAQAYCEVSLVFDNEDGALPVSFAEVMITRRVYRNGDSEYCLNKAPLPPEGHRRPAARHGHRQGGLFSHRPGPHRRDPLRQERGAAQRL